MSEVTPESAAATIKRAIEVIEVQDVHIDLLQQQVARLRTAVEEYDALSQNLINRLHKIRTDLNEPR
jgi:hypothetical protein